MNIGVVLDNEFDNDHRVQKEIRVLLSEGHSIFLLCFDFGNAYKTYNDIEVTRIPIHKKIKDALVLLSTNFMFYEFLWKQHITSFIIKNKLDALHVHDLYLAKAAKKGILASPFSIPLTLDLHENYPAAINSYEWATKGWRKYIVQPKKWYKKEGEYLKYANNLIVLSNYFKDTLLQRFSFLKATPISVHPNMPDFESFESFKKNDFPVAFESIHPTVFYFGVVAKRRGIIDILPWLIRLLEEGKKFHTLIIGPIDKADKRLFNSYINHPVLKNNLTYIPWSDVKYLPAYLKKISIGLAPFQVNAQHDSGIANKLFQYMYGEIPILATKCKAQQELIENSGCGLLYDNFEEFDENLTKLIENPELRKTLGAKGKKELLKLYKEKADCNFIEIYK
ncbi:glycosyltransferase family 4 protein [Thalassobellus suaedae]|uniref:Glycosyltransferase family 4 protein n=1 Tax=Thalassobellus suaedae TaxID=3074124 RepID=A0ABY9XQA2_9FLAO|nr:glycosyltransferase family 4 protein [Flavobacteriaceae bacterium HL-DH14]